ncbi:hypothetical protein BO82DRAFT_356474 [Aspergillus uvarum CBS 121591]|uniref:Orotidine 5'-phosphate decarboxylase domain-containing protein n=1 Tax=Aspergillus uvarum CBS 121591 TaxID=1448315 RepID=A0A319C5T1_9EURO|nr:hypothetical protein BO82DRAFT_356474 [Aspergillus uvarum CBS 121591]PYH79307.1 hypothetical protein BO82DRAFT_356474 [Aspergillus uvarum CBS 121591]
MMDSSLDSPSYPGNRIVAYLDTLVRSKSYLPYGLPVCVSPSHTVTNTDTLLHLATLVGPHIAILQVYADIIDDWSEETVRQLVALARRHGFLIWEGGRILNSTVDIVGGQKAETREVRNETVDMIRKKYTKGIIKPASWAGLSTAWASGVAVYNQEADILIPTLKAAAREAVADAAQTIRTEITADNNANNHSFSDHDADATSQHLSEYAVDNTSGLDLPPRKASTISLTQTITQHTEDSTELPLESPQYERRGFEFRSLSPATIPEDFPPPPLMARGLVLCLPSSTASSFTNDYRQSCVAAARANQDFVAGFVCGEPWHLVSQRKDLFGAGVSGYGEEQQQLSPYSSDDDEAVPHFALVSPISRRLSVVSGQGLDEVDEDEEEEHQQNGIPMPEPPLPLDSLNPLASKLFQITGKALQLRETSAQERGNLQLKADTDKSYQIMHIPLVVLP